MRNLAIAAFAVLFIAGSVSWIYLFWQQSPVSNQAADPARAQRCQEFLAAATFSNGEDADRFMASCLRGEPVLPGESTNPAAPSGSVQGEPYVGEGCVISGCSRQVCGDVADMNGGVTTCEWKEEYACYASARCERQGNGQCGWTETAELTQCQNNADASAEVDVEASTSGELMVY